MKALILETSNQKSFLLLAVDKKVEKVHLLPSGSALSKTLSSEVKTFLQGERVDWIFASQGPGSYTGTRVGAALAKGLSFGWDIPLYGFCSLEALTPSSEGSFAVLIDARLGGAYVLLGERRKDALEISIPSLVSWEDLDSFVQNREILVSPSPLDLMAKAPNLLIQEAEPCFEELAAKVFSPQFQTPLQLSYLSPSSKEKSLKS